MEDKSTENNISTCKRDQKDVRDGWNPDLNQDEAILAQERQIEKEIADNIPLISDKISLETLLNENQFTDQSYPKKIYVSNFLKFKIFFNLKCLFFFQNCKLGINERVQIDAKN